MAVNVREVELAYLRNPDLQLLQRQYRAQVGGLIDRLSRARIDNLVGLEEFIAQAQGLADAGRDLKQLMLIDAVIADVF